MALYIHVTQLLKLYLLWDVMLHNSVHRFLQNSICLPNYMPPHLWRLECWYSLLWEVCLSWYHYCYMAMKVLSMNYQVCMAGYVCDCHRTCYDVTVNSCMVCCALCYVLYNISQVRITRNKSCLIFVISERRRFISELLLLMYVPSDYILLYMDQSSQ